MPKVLAPGVEPLIFAFSREGLGPSAIRGKLNDNGYHVSVKTIYRTLNCIGKRRRIEANGGKVEKRKNKRKSKTKDLVKLVAKEVNKNNPLSQRMIARKFNTTQTNVNRIIHEDLELVTRRKSKVHSLTDLHKQNRFTNCRKLYERNLAGDKWEYLVTLDEAWLYLSYCKGQRKICYVRRGQKPIDDWMKFCSESWPVGFMVVGSICGRGVLPLIKVPPKIKINGEMYRDNVLKPLFEKYLPKLYAGEMHFVTLHHDKASSHTCKLVQTYLHEMKMKIGINYLENKDIPTKSPDGSLMDFFGFGYLKQQLFYSKVTTANGLWKKANQVWSSVPSGMINQAFQSWKKRCRTIVNAHGGHIEHTKAIHNKTLNL